MNYIISADEKRLSFIEKYKIILGRKNYNQLLHIFGFNPFLNENIILIILLLFHIINYNETGLDLGKYDNNKFDYFTKIERC